MLVATILDEFSEQCFSGEFSILQLRRNNYYHLIQTSAVKPSLLLVESAWRGADQTWKDSLVARRGYAEAMKDISLLVRSCRKWKIPTLFWNKEDPIHFNTFLPVAKQFDFVATTDQNCVYKYKGALGHSRVFVLPFAAQVDLHNPVGLENRIKSPCFAGMYWSTQHQERKNDMEFLLKPAIDYGLHIYDRSQVGGAGNPFPEPYVACVKGGLPYLALVEMYKKYRVFLNVNIVKDSPTMFSRRVFELLSCGTPVISSDSVGIRELLPEVFISNTVEDTKRYLDKLLTDDHYWKKVSIAGAKNVLSKHTYTHRFIEICLNMGIAVPEETKEREQRNLQLLEKFING